MKYKKRTDGNQERIVEYLRRVGASVFVASGVGDSFPDLVVGYRGVNYLIEVKDPAQPKSKRKLRPGQQAFAESWRGQIAKVETEDEALRLIGAIK
jgi:Holliday junction resolvase